MTGALSMRCLLTPKINFAGHGDGHTTQGENASSLNHVRGHPSNVLTVPVMDSSDYYEEDLFQASMDGGPGFREPGFGL